MVNILTILTWFTSKKAYLAPYAEDDSAKKAATKLWNAIDGGDWILFLVMVLLTAAVAWYYYIPFNNRPGRHYHPKWWWMFGAAALLAVFVVTMGLCHVLAKNPGFDFGLILDVTLMNTLYAAVVYFLFSVIINRTGKSNAYPFPF